MSHTGKKFQFSFSLSTNPVRRLPIAQLTKADDEHVFNVAKVAMREVE
jgi:hypothetical protein